MSTVAPVHSSPVDDEESDVAVRVDDVTVRFPDPAGGTKTVLSALDLQVERGQFTALVGRSGCGKTTLLNLIAGLVDASDGSVSVLGKSPRAARSELGFMLARDALLPWRTAGRNVEYGLELRGMSKTTRREVADSWLKAVHLGDAAKLWPWQLSQGMRQRVALARTWALDPEVLLMDEPFAALDAHTRVAVQAEFLRLWQGERARTVVFVTHDLGEAITLADRIILLSDGNIVDDVTVGIPRPRDNEAIVEHPRYIELHRDLREKLRGGTPLA
ncbi:MAG: ABC transporter ATP-binding protein [Microbacterium sp.]